MNNKVSKAFNKYTFTDWINFQELRPHVSVLFCHLYILISHLFSCLLICYKLILCRHKPCSVKKWLIIIRFASM